MTDFDTSDIASLQEFINKYPGFPIDAPEPPTLMDIAGFPHWENVYSNILAFFLDTKEAHGFGSLFICSIVEAYRECSDAWWPDALYPNVEATEKIKREVSTAKGKRIDILIECADFLVCIENKIWTDVHNDLGEYREHCKKNSDGHPVLGIVLSPHRVTDQKLQKHRFVSITYGDLVKQVRQRMGSYIGPHNTRYQYLLFDFLEQANQFTKTKTMTDNQRQFLEFWQLNEKKISNIHSNCNKMRSDMKTKAENHRRQCLEQLTEPERNVFKVWIHAGWILIFDIAGGGDIDGCRIYLDVKFHPLRVTHVLWARPDREPNAALVSQISAKAKIEFDNSSGRPSFCTEQSPFEDSVCERAVKTSVDILKQIAAMRFADQEILQGTS